MGGFNYRVDPETDDERLRYSVSALLASHGVKEFDGPVAAVFWAGSNDGEWAEYVEYANGMIKPYDAPRALDRSLDGVGKLVDNAVRTFAALLDNRQALGAPMPCAVVWRVRPEFVPEDDGRISWRARCAFVPLCDAEKGMSVDRPETEDCGACAGQPVTHTCQPPALGGYKAGQALGGCGPIVLGEDLIGAGWTASITRSPQDSDSGWIGVLGRVLGMTVEDALSGAKAVLEHVAGGKEAIIRVRPEATTDTDFESQEAKHKGYVRFSYRDRPGEWTFPKPPKERWFLNHPHLPWPQPVAGEYPPIKNETAQWPSPTEAMLTDPLFDAIWDAIKEWDIAVPDAYIGVSGATGNHVRAIYDAVQARPVLYGDGVALTSAAHPQGGSASVAADLSPESLVTEAAPPVVAAILEERAALHALFAEAAVTDIEPPCDLNLSSLELAASKVGRDGTLICAIPLTLTEDLRRRSETNHPVPPGFKAAPELGTGFPRLAVRNFPASVLGSPDAWALLSADRKKAVVGMR